MPPPMPQPVKIVATLGPATADRDTLRELLRAGVDVVRLNFSHGSHAEHRVRIALVRELAAELGLPIAILLDLQGPKIRTGALAGGTPVRLVPGQVFRITTRAVLGDSQRVSTSHATLAEDAKPGDRILVSDGLIELRVTSRRADEVETQVVQGGLLAERQGMHLPGMHVSAPALGEKDLRDLAFGIEQGVDFAALSFVRRPEDVLEARRAIAALGSELPVIAKLEKTEAIENLEAIARVADGLMVARGDLGVELSPEKVPLVQKRIIAVANAIGRPVITATQMLESMIEHPRPTRAEASDVANAILDGTRRRDALGRDRRRSAPARGRAHDRARRGGAARPFAHARAERSAPGLGARARRLLAGRDQRGRRVDRALAAGHRRDLGHHALRLERKARLAPATRRADPRVHARGEDLASPLAALGRDPGALRPRARSGVARARGPQRGRAPRPRAPRLDDRADRQPPLRRIRRDQLPQDPARLTPRLEMGGDGAHDVQMMQFCPKGQNCIICTS